MPTNVYFDTGTRPEQRLYEDLVIEQLRAFGQDVYYIPRTLVKENLVFGEDDISAFNDAYLLEMYFEQVEGYDGEKEIMSKFGLEMRDEATFVVSRRRWEQFIGLDQNLIVSTRPNEGDLIYFPRAKKLFEISFVDHDEPFYQIQDLPVYKLRCRTFEYASESMDTGIQEIDNIERDNSLDALQWQFILEDDTGYILLEDDNNNTYYMINEEYVVDSIDEKAQNDIFETLDDDILNFDESNPFGEIGIR